MSMSRHVWTIMGLVSLTGLLPGCVQFSSPPPSTTTGTGGTRGTPGAPGTTGAPGTSGTPGTPSSSPSYQNTTVTTGHFEGSLGTVTTFTSDAVDVQNDGTALRFDATGDGWWVMSRLDFQPALSDPSWAPGTTRTVSLTDSNGVLPLRVTGCSGPEYERWVYDGQADRVTIHVEQGSTPNERVVSFAAYWDQAPGTVSGSFTYELN